MEGDPIYSPYDINLDEECSHREYAGLRNAVRTRGD